MAIWQVDAYNRSVQQAVDEFCLTYWQEPRKHTKVKLDGSFKLVDGTNVYKCKLDNGLYEITKA